ncbi:MAG: hypothetical protein IPN47_23990 [Gemmatimonadetes bacterium]|nr:hypothetical protein [Gemmatimonadota bacterium]
MGPAATRQISAVRVHPNNPDVVYVAWRRATDGAGTAERGIYRSTDGGKTCRCRCSRGRTRPKWRGGAVGMDLTNPRILYAAMGPPAARRDGALRRSRGGIWKSTDGGDSWKRLTKGSLLDRNPDVAVSPANPER